MKYCSHLFLYLVAILGYTTYVLPLTVNATLLANKNSGKRVLLLGDAHDQNIDGILRYAAELTPTKKTLTQAALSTFYTVKRQQKKTLTKFAQAMLENNNKKSAQTVIISEIDNTQLRALCKNTLGNAFKSETFFVIPQVFMNHLWGSKSTPEDKLDMYEKSIKHFATPDNSLEFNNQLRWVAGDTLRDNNQTCLLKTINETSIQDLTSLKQSLPDHVAAISIGDIKKNILQWRHFFASCGIDDQYNEKALALLDEELQTGKAFESTPIIDLTIQLRNDDPAKAKALYSYLGKLGNNQFDFELSAGYVKAFEDDASLKYLIINAGHEHTDFVKNKLIKDGFYLVETRGSNVSLTPEFKEASPAKALVILSKALDHVKKQSPHKLLPKLFQA